MKNSAYTKPLIWNFNATGLFYIFVKVHRNALELKKNVKKLELEGDWAKLGPKMCLLRQSRTKYLEQNGIIH